MKHRHDTQTMDLNFRKKRKSRARALPDAPFDGATYDDARDRGRLSGQILRVYNCILDGGWRTLDDICAVTGDPHASVSAQLRHLRKEKFGSHDIDRRHLGDGLYQYRLVPR